jgi:hypothetical protein
MKNMPKTITGVLVAASVLAGAMGLHAQSTNKVWFVMWNGQPTPGNDVAVQSIATDGSGGAIVTGTASNVVSQVNFPAFSSPYDIAVDQALGKVYVLDNNVSGAAPEYIYSFNLTGTPAQIAASVQTVYTMPVPAADVNAGLYPLVSGLTLDQTGHYLYFNQVDVTTGSNSYIGRLTLTNSLKTSLLSSNTNNPALQTLYVGQIPSQGPIAIDAANLYLSAINGPGNNDGIYVSCDDWRLQLFRAHYQFQLRPEFHARFCRRRRQRSGG